VIEEDTSEIVAEDTTKSLVKSIVAEARKGCKEEKGEDEEMDDSEDDEEIEVSDDDMEDDEDVSESISTALKKDAQKKKTAISKAKSWMKKLNKSAEDAAKEFDLKVSDLKESTEVEGEVVTEEVAEETEISISEDVAAMFEGEDLSEEFKKKAGMIFEAAVAVRVNAQIQTITEDVRKEFEGAAEQMRTELTEAVNSYTSYAATKWAEDNKIAIQSNLKTELVEDFLHGMKSLFAEHYIDLPDEAVDVVEEMSKKVEFLELQLSEAVKTNVALTEEVNVNKKVVVLEDTITDLSENQKEKIRSLAESVEFESEEDFKSKVATLVTSYFPSKAPVVTEDVELPTETLTEEVDPAMAAYVKTLARSVK
jgi:hypothetical protein